MNTSFQVNNTAEIFFSANQTTSLFPEENHVANLNGSGTFASTMPSFGPVVEILNYFLLLVSSVIVCLDVVTISLLRNCRRVPRLCVILSVNFLITDAVGSAVFIAHQFAIYTLGLNNDIAHNSRIVTVGIVALISSASLIAVALERVKALTQNLTYFKTSNMATIYSFIVFIWAVSIVFISLIVLIKFRTNCSFTLENCNIWAMNRLTKFVLMATALFYDIILIIANTVIFKIVRGHERQINALEKMTFQGVIKNPDCMSERQYAASRLNMKVLDAYIILQVPICSSLFLNVADVDSRHETFQRVHRGLSYLCFQLNSFINIMYFYVWKQSECKMYLYTLLAKCFKSYEQKAELLRLKVYNIVISLKTYSARDYNTDV